MAVLPDTLLDRNDLYDGFGRVLVLADRLLDKGSDSDIAKLTALLERPSVHLLRSPEEAARPLPAGLAERVIQLPATGLEGSGSPVAVDRLPPFWRALLGLALILADPDKPLVLHGLEEELSALENACQGALDGLLLWLKAQAVTLISTSPGTGEPLRSIYVERYVERDGQAPLVSIVLPVFNGEAFLEAALDSILRQSFEDFELLCIDDGSGDSTPAILAVKSRADPRLLVVRQDNAGTSAARNRGLDLARGRYVCFADADDLLASRSLERRVRLLEEGGAEVCGGRVEMVDEAGHPLGVTTGRRRTAWYRDAGLMPFHISTVMGRSHVMKRFRFPRDVRFAEDWAYLAQILRHGWPIASCGEESLSSYRWHEGSVTGQSLKDLVAGCLTVLDELSDMPPTALCDLERPEGAMTLSRERLGRAKRRWLEWQLVALVLGSDHDARREALRQLGAVSPRQYRAPNAAFFDTIAVRSLLLPKGSGLLDSALASCIDPACALIAGLPQTRCNRAFSIAFRRYLMAAARRQKMKGGPAVPLAAHALRLAADRAVFTLLYAPQTLVRRCGALGRRTIARLARAQTA